MTGFCAKSIHFEETMLSQREFSGFKMYGFLVHAFFSFPNIMNPGLNKHLFKLISYSGRMVHSLQGWRAINPRCNKLRAKGILAGDNRPRVQANFSRNSLRHPVEQKM